MISNDDHYMMIMALMAESRFHQHWSDEDIDHFIDTPIQLNQYVIGLDKSDEAMFFATFARPEHHHLEKYITENKFPKEGYYGDGENIWIIDFMCKPGVKNIARSFRTIKYLLSSMGEKRCLWLRSETGKVGWHELKE